jgi:hypothetical protein
VDSHANLELNQENRISPHIKTLGRRLSGGKRLCMTRFSYSSVLVSSRTNPNKTIEKLAYKMRRVLMRFVKNVVKLLPHFGTLRAPFWHQKALGIV